MQDKVCMLFKWQRIWQCKYEYNKDWPENLFAYCGLKNEVNYIIWQCKKLKLVLLTIISVSNCLHQYFGSPYRKDLEIL